jgi:Cu+-exporting ATPase
MEALAMVTETGTKPHQHGHGEAGRHAHGHGHAPARSHDQRGGSGHAHGALPDGMVKDPVCGMAVDPREAKQRAHYHGEDFYFCSASCRTKFLAAPERYARPAEATSVPDAPEGTIFTCPMHPEIRQIGPGSCPICGMALEPLIATGDEGPSEELRDMTRRFWVGLVMAVPVFLLEMGGHLVDIGHLIGGQASSWIQMVLSTPVVLWAGWPFFVRGWNSLVNRSLNMFTLIAMGTGIAWLYSMIATLTPGLFPAEFQGHDGSVAVYFEAAAVITVLVLLGQVLELRAREQTSGAIKALLNLAPATARRIAEDGSETDIDLGHVQVGDRLRVRPGDKVPLDGEVWKGAPMSTNPW